MDRHGIYYFALYLVTRDQTNDSVTAIAILSLPLCITQKRSANM